jgi:PAS domain S-box-containing protein
VRPHDLKCWEFHHCSEKDCPAYGAANKKCWLVSGTHCREDIQGTALEKMKLCLKCLVFEVNMDMDSMSEVLNSVNVQFIEYKEKVEERDRELERLSMEMAIGLSEVFEALKEISSGNPDVRIPEASELELISKLKHMVNLTAENIGEIVGLSHEFAIGLAEHFDVLHRVSKGDLSARVSSVSQVELIERLGKVTNLGIENVSKAIAERERVEAELRRSEEKYRQLFSSGPDPVFVLDARTLEILDLNPSAEAAYGFTRETLKGKPFTDLGPFEYDISNVTSLEKGGWQNACLVSEKVKHFRKGETPFYVNVHACSTKYRDKDAFILSVTDVTEMLEKDAQLIQASKMASLGEMSAGIAHELNQPLNVIKIGTEYLKMSIKEGKAIDPLILLQVAQDASEQVDRASEIINRLRDFGRMSDFSRQEVDVNKLIRNVIAVIGEQLRLQSIEVRLDLNEDLGFILGHGNRLEQVIFNLVTNARDAINQNTDQVLRGTRRITIRSFRENGRFSVTVSDTGTGIRQEVKAKIFEPFFTTKEVGKGMGLGLSIVYGIVRDHGGEINVHSEEGVGTTFKLSFPLLPDRYDKRNLS